MKPLVYVAGPYTEPDPVENTRAAFDAGSRLLDTALVVAYVPHMSMFWHFLHPRPYADWLELDLEIVDRCDALLRLPGKSPGADREVERAQRRGIPVFLVEPPGGFNFIGLDTAIADVSRWAEARLVAGPQ